ncbi:MAG: AMP-binding protein [Xanthobacteraceae bacterium]
MTTDQGTATGRALYERWRGDPEAFWAEAARALDWTKAPERIFDPARGWFPDGICNACWNAVDRHVIRGEGARPAIGYRSDTGGERIVAYERLWTELQVLGAILRDCGVGMGERVAILMPPLPEAVFGMLACARIGAVHVAISGDASTDDIAKVVGRTKPKAILTAGGGHAPHKSRLDEALALACHESVTCVVLQRAEAPVTLDPQRDRDWRMLWEEAVNYAKTSDCVMLAADHPLCILPDGAVRDHGASMVALALAAKSSGVEGDDAPPIADIATPAAQSVIYGSLLGGQAVRLVEGTAVGGAISLPWTMPRSLDEPPISA